MSCSIITIIPLFLFALLAGAVLIYLNFKIIDIKREVDKQNKILLSFISDIKLNLVNNQGHASNGAVNGGDGSLASDGALAFVNKLVECDIKCGSPVFSAPGKDLCSRMGMNITLESFSDDDSGSDTSDDESISLIIDVSDVELPVTESVSLPSIGLIDVVDIADDVLITDNVNPTQPSIASDVIDYNNMKVEQLRKVVLEKLLAPTKEVNKMKKVELLALMSRNK